MSQENFINLPLFQLSPRCGSTSVLAWLWRTSSICVLLLPLRWRWLSTLDFHNRFHLHRYLLSIVWSEYSSQISSVRSLFRALLLDSNETHSIILDSLLGLHSVVTGCCRVCATKACACNILWLLWCYFSLFFIFALQCDEVSAVFARSFLALFLTQFKTINSIEQMCCCCSKFAQPPPAELQCLRSEKQFSPDPSGERRERNEIEIWRKKETKLLDHNEQGEVRNNKK